jgi:hypothetical protein
VFQDLAQAHLVKMAADRDVKIPKAVAASGDPSAAWGEMAVVVRSSKDSKSMQPERSHQTWPKGKPFASPGDYAITDRIGEE